MSNFQATGTLHEIFDTQQVTEKFRKQDFVLKLEDGQWPQFVLFQFSGERCGTLEKYKIAVGDTVTVSFNLTGRPWEKGERKGYMNTLQAWRVDKANADASTPAPAPSATVAPATKKPVAPPQANTETHDDLPF